MKYLSVLAGFALAVFLTTACMSNRAENAPSSEGGSYYEGSAMGYRGEIRVRVGFEKGAITDITVIESSEDRAVGGVAIEELTDLVLMYNTTEIDAVSGATETSKGFLEAIENAIMNL
jgi:uncharacterized protein with FMN-binding domain